MRQKEFLKVSSVQEKPEIEMETIIAITEAALIIYETIAIVERDRQHQEARTEAEIGRTRVSIYARTSGAQMLKKRFSIWSTKEYS